MFVFEGEKFPLDFQRKDGMRLKVESDKQYVICEIKTKDEIISGLSLANSILPYPITTLHPIYKKLTESIKEQKGSKGCLGVVLKKETTIMGIAIYIWNEETINKKRKLTEEDEDEEKVIEIELAVVAVSFQLRGYGVFCMKLMKLSAEMLRGKIGKEEEMKSVVKVHVQEDNKDGVRFYEKNGFTTETKEEGYYKTEGKKKGSRNAIVMTIPLTTL